MGEPRFSCFPFPGLKGLRSNSSVSSSTHSCGRRNLAWKSWIRGQDTRGSTGALITRPDLHRFCPHRVAYFWVTSRALFLAKDANGRALVTGFSGRRRFRPPGNKEIK